MIQALSSAAALILMVGVAVGPGDPVGIGDVLAEPEVGVRQVSIELERWKALEALAELELPEVRPPGPWAADRRVVIERSPEGIRVRATWSMEAMEPGWWAGTLVGPVPGMRVESTTWRGRDIGVTGTPAGEEVALKMGANSRGQLKLVVFIPGDQLPGGVDGDLEMELMPAVRGELRLGPGEVPEGRVAELVAGGQARRAIAGRFWASEAQLGLTWVDADREPAQLEGTVAVAQTAMGLTFGDGEVRGRARVSWLLRQGQLEAVTLDTAGLGPDLEVTGPNVHAWTRNGDRVEVVLKEATDGRLDIDLRWTQGLPSGAEGKLDAPRITPRQAYRAESFMQIARDGELEILPKLGGWSAVARAELPDWAGGYIQGTATATFRSDGGGDGGGQGASFELLRFVPLTGPPVMVDVAAYEIATTQEGRALVQARYDVRNERASHLRVELPKGARVLGVRVNGEAVTPARDANSGEAEIWRVPLVRSLESVKGSLSFPVEVLFIGASTDWKKRESRELELPALDAPVAVSRVRVYLPPNYENRVDLGDSHRVSGFSEGEGITYGMAAAAGSAEVARADELYREALDGWMANDFGRAQSSLDELGALGASNANISGLQANVDLVQGRTDAKADKDSGGGQSAVVSRRIKDQARMRAADDKIELEEKAREADELEAKGAYEEAEVKLAEAQELGDRLALLEQSESQEQVVYNRSLSSSSVRIAKKKERKVNRESRLSKAGKASKTNRANKGSKASSGGKAYKAKEGADGYYSFEDDNAEAWSVTVEDADIWNSSDAPSAGPQGGEPTPEAEPEPAPDPAPVDTPTDTAAPIQDISVIGNLLVTDESQALEGLPPMEQTVTLEDAEKIPVGDSSRDFTAVVSVVPGVAVPSDVSAAKGRRGRGRPAKAARAQSRRGGKGKGKATNAAESPDEPARSMLPPAPPADPNAALAGPVATASAVSVHVPAIGEAVLYQHMLLPEGKALTVHLEARRRKPSKRRSK